ncbi:MAG: hypothetical protein M3Z54_03070 [Gemmatimonadota bacterium]|nr:hypothetical protein [Gemmatimonadota bacterium]
MFRQATLLGVALFAAACVAQHANPATATRPDAATGAVPLACAVPLGDTAYTIMSATLPRRQPELFATATGVLRAQGFTIARIDSAAGQLVTAPRFISPTGTDAEGGHGQEKTGVVATVRATSRGADSTDFLVATRALCVVPEPGQERPSEKVGKMLEMITAMQITKAVRTSQRGP